MLQTVNRLKDNMYNNVVIKANYYKDQAAIKTSLHTKKCRYFLWLTLFLSISFPLCKHFISLTFKRSSYQKDYFTIITQVFSLFQLIVGSQETEKGCLKVNEKRAERNVIKIYLLISSCWQQLHSDSALGDINT